MKMKFINRIRKITLILIVVIQHTGINYAHTMDSSSIEISSNKASWEIFVIQNPNCPFAWESSDLILELKQFLDVDSRVNLAMTSWGMQNALYNPDINEFVLPGWEYIEQKHMQWSDTPQLRHRTLSILNWRLMTILGLHINMSYEPESIDADVARNHTYYILNNHNRNRLIELCKNIKNAPFSILPDQSIARIYIDFLYYIIAEKYPIHHEAEQHILQFPVLGISESTHVDLFKNSDCLLRHCLQFLKDDIEIKGGYILTADPDCSLFEVLKNYETVKKLKEYPDLYKGNIYTMNDPKKAELAKIWKEILLLDFGATLLSYRLGFFSNFNAEYSYENLFYGKIALSISKHNRDTLLDDLCVYCEASSMLKGNNRFDYLLKSEEMNISESDTIGYVHFCLGMSKAYQNISDEKNEIKYLEQAKGILQKLNLPVGAFIYKGLARAYEKIMQYDEAIRCYESLLNRESYKPKPNKYSKLASLCNKIHQYKKEGHYYRKKIQLLESSNTEFDPFCYLSAAYAYCDGGKFKKAAQYLDKYLNKKPEIDKNRLSEAVTIYLLSDGSLNISYLTKLKELTQESFYLWAMRSTLFSHIIDGNFELAKNVIQNIQNHYKENPNEKHRNCAEFLLSFIKQSSDLTSIAESYDDKPYKPESWGTPFYLSMKYLVLKKANHPKAENVLTEDTLNLDFTMGCINLMKKVQYALDKVQKEGFKW